MSITIRRADYMDVDALVPLFDGYRQFYKWPSDETLARSFLSERLRAEEQPRKPSSSSPTSTTSLSASPCSIRASPRQRPGGSSCSMISS